MSLFSNNNIKLSILSYFKSPLLYLHIMSCLQVLLAIIFPPLAVVDKGCGSVIIVVILTCFGWVPGVIAALIILNSKKG